MRAEWISPDCFSLLLTALMPENRLALQVSMATGLRIGDVLRLKTKDIERQRFTVQESKTGKRKRVYLPQKLWKECWEMAGATYVFPGRLDSRKHRTRQAVYKDLRRVAALYRIDGRKIQEHISPHSARKLYAVDAYRSGASLEKVQGLLNHTSEAVTMIYAMADLLTAQRAKKKRRG